MRNPRYLNPVGYTIYVARSMQCSLRGPPAEERQPCVVQNKSHEHAVHRQRHPFRRSRDTCWTRVVRAQNHTIKISEGSVTTAVYYRVSARRGTRSYSLFSCQMPSCRCMVNSISTMLPLSADFCIHLHLQQSVPTPPCYTRCFSNLLLYNPLETRWVSKGPVVRIFVHPNGIWCVKNTN